MKMVRTEGNYLSNGSWKNTNRVHRALQIKFIRGRDRIAYLMLRLFLIRIPHE